MYSKAVGQNRHKTAHMKKRGELKTGGAVGRESLEEVYLDILKKYPMIFIEDPFDQDDWHNFEHITALNLVPVPPPPACPVSPHSLPIICPPSSAAVIH